MLSDTGKTKLTGGTVFNPFLLNGLFYHNTLDWFIANRRGVWFCLYYVAFLVFNINGVDPDQMPHFKASDLVLYCLAMSLL